MPKKYQDVLKRKIINAEFAEDAEKRNVMHENEISEKIIGAAIEGTE